MGVASCANMSVVHLLVYAVCCIVKLTLYDTIRYQMLF